MDLLYYKLSLGVQSHSYLNLVYAVLKKQVPRVAIYGCVWPHVARPLLLLTLEDRHLCDPVIQGVIQVEEE